MTPETSSTTLIFSSRNSKFSFLVIFDSCWQILEFSNQKMKNEGGLRARSLGTPFGARLDSLRPIEKPSTLLFLIKTALPCTILIFLAAGSQGCSLAPKGVCRPHACHFHYVAIFERTVESKKKFFDEKIFSIPIFRFKIRFETF